jgi:Outer membrane protein beta-barrel domain
MQKCTQLLVLVGMLVPASVWAQNNANPPPIVVGVDLQLAPTGTITSSLGNLESSNDAAASYGIGGLVDFGVSGNISVGFAPRYLLNVRAANSQNDPNGNDNTATELDLRFRVAYHVAVARKVQAYGFVAPGYSVVFAPKNANNDNYNPKGLIIGLGGGALYALRPNLALTGEIGYQVGYQATTVNVLGIKSDVSYETEYLHLSVGLAFALK